MGQIKNSNTVPWVTLKKQLPFTRYISGSSLHMASIKKRLGSQDIQEWLAKI